MWHYADYTLILPALADRKPVFEAYYVAPDGKRYPCHVGPTHVRFGLALVRYQSKADDTGPLPVHVQRRILAAQVPAALTLTYDRQAKLLMLVDADGEQFHIEVVEDARQARRIVQEAVRAFRTRRAQKLATSPDFDPARVWVSVRDSLESGNCRPETDRFATQRHDELRASGKLGAVRADVILGLRDDSYTRRAVVHAAARTV